MFIAQTYGVEQEFARTVEADEGSATWKPLGRVLGRAFS